MRARNRSSWRQAALLVLAVVSIPSLACAAGSVTTTVDHVGSVLQVRSTLIADAPAATCYAVLADFDRLAEFVPRMKSSHITSAPGQPIRLRQVGDAGVGFFHVTVDVTLAVTETPPRRLDFHRIAGNLKEMQGSWTVSGSGTRCEIDYRSDIEPEFWVPPMIG